MNRLASGLIALTFVACIIWLAVLSRPAKATTVEAGPDLMFLAEAARQCNAHCDLTGTAEWTATLEGKALGLRCVCKQYRVEVTRR